MNSMKWYNPLYFSENISVDMQQVIIHNINNDIYQKDIYIISLCESGKDLFKIIPSEELLQKAYPKKDRFIIGIAQSKEEAFTLVESIITEIYTVDGHLHNVKEFFQK